MAARCSCASPSTSEKTNDTIAGRQAMKMSIFRMVMNTPKSGENNRPKMMITSISPNADVRRRTARRRPAN